VLQRQRDRGPALRALAFALAAVLSSAAGLRGGSRERVLLPVSVNGVAKGDLLAFFENDDVLLRVADLEGAGVRGFSGHRVPAPEGELVTLGSLAPDITFLLDSESVALTLTTLPRYLGSTTRDLKTSRPDSIAYTTDTSAFLNYSANWRDFKSFDAFAETGISLHGNLLYASGSRDAQGRFTRGLTSYTVDDRERLTRWVVGDGFASGGTLGGALLLGGVGVSRNFELDPYFVRYPTFGLSGAVMTPSTADVYVNGAIVRREQLPPGQFDLTNLPVPAGSGNATVVIRDAFGGERTLASPFYSSSAVLARGLSEYTYNIGFVRRPLGVSGGDYESAPAFLGRHRLGVTDSFTPEVRLEARSGFWSGGPGVALRLPFGEAGASFAWSRDGGDSGTAASFAYQYLGQPVNFGVFARVFSARYANLSLHASEDRPLTNGGAFAGIQAGRVSLTAQYEVNRMRDTPSTARVSLSASAPLSRDWNVFLSGGRSLRAGGAALEAFAGLSYSLGGGAIASLTHERTADGVSSTSATVQKSLPLGAGYGYQVTASGGAASDSGRGLFQYQGPYGRYEAWYERLNGQSVETLSMSGGIVAIGGTVAPSRAVGQSFALLRVPGVPGVTGFSSNQPVGQTNRHGDLLVPEILPYYGNRVGIADTDVPQDYSIGETEKTVAPPYRGGALIVFPVARARAVTGFLRIEIDGEETVPAFGTLTLAAGGKQIESPIGSKGEFFLENIPPGRHEALVQTRSASCRIAIEVPDTREQFFNIGTLSCRAAAP
jgi:outer membrane usher protein